MFGQDRAVRDMKYGVNSDDIPIWVTMMNDSIPNLIAIREAYNEYYKINTFKKNEYTQFYKRWMRVKWDHIDANGDYRPDPPKEYNRKLKSYLNKLNHSTRRSNSNWEEIGPWEYDHEATMNLSSQSPGAAHIWTVEQSKSNPDIIWAGTANAGIWRSPDRGQSWERKNTLYPFNGVYSIEIDFSNPSIVYAEGSGFIWKTVDGGETWNSSEQIQYFDWIRDIKMDPINNQKIFVASVSGLYSTEDSGASYKLIESGHFQEIEFHPTDPNIIYVVQLEGNHTVLWRSEDGGQTFKLKVNGWPGIGSVSTVDDFSSISFQNAIAEVADLNLGETLYEDFTIDLRFKASNWSGDPAFFSNKNWNNGLNRGWIMACNGNSWKFNIGDGSERIDLNGEFVNDNKWHHLAVSFDKDDLKFTFQDGQIVASSTANLQGDLSSSLSAFFAQDGTGNYGFPFLGELGEIRIWNKALSVSELERLSCTEITSNDPILENLVHHWNIEDQNATSFLDMEGDKDAIIDGTPIWIDGNEMTCMNVDLGAGEEQRRCEIAVSPAAPDNIYVLASGSAKS